MSSQSVSPAFLHFGRSACKRYIVKLLAHKKSSLL